MSGTRDTRSDELLGKIDDTIDDIEANKLNVGDVGDARQASRCDLTATEEEPCSGCGKSHEEEFRKLTEHTDWVAYIAAAMLQDAESKHGGDYDSGAEELVLQAAHDVSLYLWNVQAPLPHITNEEFLNPEIREAYASEAEREATGITGYVHNASLLIAYTVYQLKRVHEEVPGIQRLLNKLGFDPSQIVGEPIVIRVPRSGRERRRDDE